MIYELYAIFFFITLIFIFVGYFAEADVLKIVGYGLVFILGIMLFQPNLFFGSVEACEYQTNYTDNVQIWGNNFTGYHWDYMTPLEPRPQDSDVAFLFHVKEYPNYNYVCQTITNWTIGFWISLLGLFGFVTVFFDRRNNHVEAED